MNKTAIRNFAVWARNKLIADVSYHAGLMGITKNGISQALPQSTKDVEFFDIGTAEPYAVRGEAIKQRKSLIEAIRQKEKDSNYETAYSSLMEEVAYTWFNRLIAVRFMEVNDYLPAHVRVLSSESGKQEPDIVTNPFDAELFFAEGENQKIIQMKNDNKLDEVFRMLFVKQCRELSRILPRLFEGTNDYTELLLSVSFIDQEGVVYHLVHDISEEDFNIEQGGQVEIIGWLYQYYNAELKDETFALLKNNVKVTKERIPSATQLFTPDWIVRYMVENSLGRLWIEGHPNDLLKSGWKYYLDEAEQEESVKQELEKIKAEYAKLSPEDIKVIDPCMGSGHILVYAFDVLMQIYESAGYTQRDAAKSIIEKNLFGLDIDDRAAQLAYFAVMMKARQYNRRILDGEADCNVYAIKESNGFDRAALVKMGDDLKPVAEKLVDTFVDAKEYGSILNVDLTLEELDALDKRLDDVDRMSDCGNLLDMMYASILCNELSVMIRQARVMVQKYDAVITNPPYMGAGNMNTKLVSFIKTNYAEYKADLFSAFIIKCMMMCKEQGYSGFLSPYVWMFIQSYEKLREYIYYNCNIQTLIQFEYSAFEEATVPICTFVIGAHHCNMRGNYIRLTDYKGGMEIQRRKALEAISNHDCGYYYESTTAEFSIIPGNPVAYWLSDNAFEGFRNGTALKKISKPKTGMRTGDNDRFLRLWYEIECNKFGVGYENSEEALQSANKWFPYNKGGDYRLWYGNNALVVNWENDGKEIKDNTRRVYPQLGDNLAWKITNEPDYFKSGITWTALTSGKNSFRYSDSGFIFDSNKGPMIFLEGDDLFYLLGYLNSDVAVFYLRVINPTLSLQNGDLENISIIINEMMKEKIVALVQENIDMARNDWDSFETSWDFKKHPLI